MYSLQARETVNLTKENFYYETKGTNEYEQW